MTLIAVVSMPQLLVDVLAAMPDSLRSDRYVDFLEPVVRMYHTALYINSTSGSYFSRFGCDEWWSASNFTGEQCGVEFPHTHYVWIT